MEVQNKTNVTNHKLVTAGIYKVQYTMNAVPN